RHPLRHHHSRKPPESRDIKRSAKRGDLTARRGGDQMGSRGYITFIINGEPKNAYNHDDSGPAHLGLRVLDWLPRADPEQLTASIENLKAVTEDQPPTPGQLRRLQEWSGSERTGRPEDQWYRLLRGTQGDPAAILAIGYVISDADYSLDAQW